MAQPIKSTFTKYSLTDEELKAGQTFTTDNHNHIQNLIADLAESRLAIRFDPLNPLAFAQREAELTGQIGILTYLLETSISTSNFLTL